MRLNHVTLTTGIYTETLARLYLKQGFVRTCSGYLSPFSPRAARAIISSTSVCAPWSRSWHAGGAGARPCGAVCCS